MKIFRNILITLVCLQSVTAVSTDMQEESVFALSGDTLVSGYVRRYGVHISKEIEAKLATYIWLSFDKFIKSYLADNLDESWPRPSIVPLDIQRLDIEKLKQALEKKTPDCPWPRVWKADSSDEFAKKFAKQIVFNEAGQIGDKLLKQDYTLSDSPGGYVKENWNIEEQESHVESSGLSSGIYWDEIKAHSYTAKKFCSAMNELLRVLKSSNCRLFLSKNGKIAVDKIDKVVAAITIYYLETIAASISSPDANDLTCWDERKEDASVHLDRLTPAHLIIN